MGSLHRDVGYVIFDDVFGLFDESSGSSNSSGLLRIPKEYISLFRRVGIAFSCFSYTPYLDPEKVEFRELQAHFMLQIPLGYHMYIAERSLRTQNQPFQFTLDEKLLSRLTQTIFSVRSEDVVKLQSTCVADEAFELVRKQVKKHPLYPKFERRGYKLRRMMVRHLSNLALFMGYNFAHEVVFPQIPLTDDWPEKVLHASDILTSDS